VIHRIPLNIDQKTGKVDEDNPFDVTESTETAMKPKHTGPVLCLASPNAGMFITGGQDGSIRVWECPEEDNKSETRRQRHPSSQQLPKCIYALSGYKIWLSNISTDGSRIVSDGGENNLIVRDFSWKSDGDGKVSL
jgi:WD40 repeat protein